MLAVRRWMEHGTQQVFRIFGFAGVGKTTLARHFAEGVEGLVLYGAYTGKAAYVLRQMGCLNATTLHSMIYHAKEKGRAHLKELEQALVELRIEMRDESQVVVDGNEAVRELQEKIEEENAALARPIFALNPDSAVAHAKLVIVDEVSTVDTQLGEDLLSFGTKVLVLGDPAQLPPIYGAGFFTEGITPDVMLTEIHRQALDNPIIAMATQVREKRPLQLGNYGESCVVEQSQIDAEMAQSADQMLVGRNRTRHSSNRRMRELLGFSGLLPVEGDRLVCLRNNHNVGLLNGAIWNVKGIGYSGEDRIFMSLCPEMQGMDLDVEAHTHHFLGKEDNLPWWERKEAEEFDFGYALTVHKAQGSQWKDVLLFDESYCFRSDRWRWLYTGLTRAAERITVVRMQ